MAHIAAQLDQELFCCSICKDLLKDPVTISCGHSYCLSCLKIHWDAEDTKKVYSCPDCEQTFTPRPVLEKHAVLAGLVEELKKISLQAAPADHCYAGPGDVACDFCTGTRLKAVKFCLVCVFSYCEKHLQPHKELSALKKHTLVDPFQDRQDNICSHHGEVMEMFCRTDQQRICYLCSVHQHKGHNTVGENKKERTVNQRKINSSRRKLRQKLHAKQEDVKALARKVEVFTSSADKEVEETERVFNERINFLQKRRSEVHQLIRSWQAAEVKRVNERQEKVEQELAELKRKEADLLAQREALNEYPE
uniref:E3 ubiquitin/ISG15 ligase TRIM25-like n=1 Tax=Solea senegalensis TaxID=28829 RepID=UPI001CD82722|nr:E3 ubiquitin/ISG15 ligase TRIM25-like [Solea senegalensis]